MSLIEIVGSVQEFKFLIIETIFDPTRPLHFVNHPLRLKATISFENNLRVLKVPRSCQETTVSCPNSQLMNATANHHLTRLVANEAVSDINNTNASTYTLASTYSAESIIFTLLVFSFLFLSANSKVENEIGTPNDKLA